MKRWILHVDMDAFFAAVEVRDNPALSGKPLIIGALPSERGVVSTCSYEARTFGVHSGMSIKEAYRLCPDGIYMHGNFPKYQAVSDELHRILREYTDQTLFIALDEGYLDVTGSLRLFGSAETIGRQIKDLDIDERQFARTEAIILSMTAEERARPEIINPSRKRRIAAGCGMRVEDVNRLLKQYDSMKQLMKRMRGMGGKKGMRGMPMMPRGGNMPFGLG